MARYKTAWAVSCPHHNLLDTLGKPTTMYCVGHRGHFCVVMCAQSDIYSVRRLLQSLLKYQAKPVAITLCIIADIQSMLLHCLCQE